MGQDAGAVLMPPRPRKRPGISHGRKISPARKVEYARVNYTLPCGKCCYPMVRSDRGRCPRCAAGEAWRVIA